MALRINIQQWQTIPIDAQFQCAAGEVVAIVGPSGTGKSTLLRCIAGLYQPDAGFIYCDDECWLDKSQGIHLSPQLRQVGFVFQDFALFPHKTVLDNVLIAMATIDKAQALRYLEQVHLNGLETRLPATLSGGQKQRLAIARALARQPKVLLLDEPFSAVDQVTRRKLRLEMQQLTRQLNLPIILVTHDLDEACFLADKMIVLHKGKTLQQGSPQQVLQFPQNSTVAKLVDVRNLFTGVIEDGQLLWSGQSLTILPSFEILENQFIHWCIRPTDILLHSRRRVSNGDKENALTVRLIEMMAVGGIVTLIVQLINQQTQLQMDLPPHVVERNQLRIGETLNISLLSKAIHLMVV